MAIQPNRTFGSRFGNAAPEAPAADARPKAEYWLNVGYVSTYKDEDGTYRFVSLSAGIPLDTIEVLSTASRNTNFAYFRQAQNELREELLVEAAKLKPGEDLIFDAEPGQLTFQLRRVGGEVAPPTGINPFRRTSVGE